MGLELGSIYANLVEDMNKPLGDSLGCNWCKLPVVGDKEMVLITHFIAPTSCSRVVVEKRADSTGRLGQSAAQCHKTMRFSDRCFLRLANDKGHT